MARRDGELWTTRIRGNGYDVDDVARATGNEVIDFWIVDSDVSASGKLRKKLQPGDVVIGYQYELSPKRRAALRYPDSHANRDLRYRAWYRSSPFPRRELWLVETRAEEYVGGWRGFATHVSYSEYDDAEHASYMVVRTQVHRRDAFAAIVGYALQTADDGYERVFFPKTDVQQCTCCGAFKKLGALKNCTLDYRGKQWDVGTILFKGMPDVEGLRRDLIGYNVCVKCRKQITALMVGLIDLHLAIACIEEECYNVSQGITCYVTPKEVGGEARRRYGRIDTTAPGNVSRLAREAFDRERSSSASARGGGYS